MGQLHHSITERKYKHLSAAERGKIEYMSQHGSSTAQMARELGRSYNCIKHELERGMTDQIKQNKHTKIYLADHGEAVYEKDRERCVRKTAMETSGVFIDKAVSLIKEKEMSVDAAVGWLKLTGGYRKTACTNTIYACIHAGELSIKDCELPNFGCRRRRTQKNHLSKRHLGNSIEQRPKEIEKRIEIGHWEADTVVGPKGDGGPSLFVLCERTTMETIIHQIPSASTEEIMKIMDKLRKLYGKQFNKVFKTITTDNGSEFSELYKLDELAGTKVFFTHAYSSFEKGTVERHNGLIRRKIPKGKSMKGLTEGDVEAIEEWMNGLPRRTLGYRQPDVLFEAFLDDLDEGTYIPSPVRVTSTRRLPDKTLESPEPNFQISGQVTPSLQFENLVLTSPVVTFYKVARCS